MLSPASRSCKLGGRTTTVVLNEEPYVSRAEFVSKQIERATGWRAWID
jgi:hypothetical protein